MEDTHDAKPIYTTGDIARMLGVNFRTVIRWIEQGRLRAYQLPGRGDNRVRGEELLAFLKKHDLPLPPELADGVGRVLVVEDDQAVRQIIVRILQHAGYQTRTASNGFDAGAEAMAFRPALITLDLGLPGLGGLDVLRFVRERPELRATRVLVVSAWPAEMLARALEAGADAVAAKPFDNEALLEQVRRLAPLASGLVHNQVDAI